MLVEHKQTPKVLKKIKMPPPSRLIMQSTKIGACDLWCLKKGLITLQKTCSHNAILRNSQKNQAINNFSLEVMKLIIFYGFKSAV